MDPILPKEIDQPIPADLLRHTRIDGYSLLAALLNKAPSADLLLQMRHTQWEAHTPEDLIAALIDLRDTARHTTVQDAEKEFQSLFVGLGQGEVVPYASWYLEGMLMTLPLARLRLALSKYGVVRRPSVHESEDHAGLMCETLVLLAGDRRLSIRDYHRFFNEHISLWMFDLFADLVRAPSAKFYRSVGRLGTCMLAMDQRFLSNSGVEVLH